MVRYRLTSTGKILIFQIFLFFIGIACGLVWKTYTNNKKWDSLIYSGVKISGLHLNNRSIKEDEALIKSQYIDPLMKKSIKVVVNNKIYSLENSKLIKEYAIESPVIDAVNLDNKLSLHEKDRILQKGVSQLYKVEFDYDENYIRNFIKGIENDFSRQAVNASIHAINHESIKVNPSITGCKVDEAGLENDIKEKINDKNTSDMSVKVRIINSEAVISTNKVSSVNAKISSYTTSFSSSSYARSNNIGLAAKLINGTLLMPGESFSFNNTVGERTKERGFMEAPVIVNDKIDSGIGGGICQVSSTLYNAILKTGIKPFQRTHHSLPSSYVGLGLDATVDWNNIDFKFENTLSYPIFIEAYIQNKNLTINIYSNSKLLSKKYVISNIVYQEGHLIEAAKGTIIMEKQERKGYRVRVVRDAYDNGKLVASEIISDDEY